MNTSLTGLVLAACLIASSAAFAQAPTTAPAGSTGQCKDGSYTSDATKKGSCAGHKGVKDWYGPAAVANPFGVSASAPAVTSTDNVNRPAAQGSGLGRGHEGHDDGAFDSVRTGRRSRASVGQQQLEGLSLRGHEVLRQDQAGRVHDRGGGQGRGQPC
jgi:hypothetical protein